METAARFPRRLGIDHRLVSRSPKLVATAPRTRGETLSNTVAASLHRGVRKARRHSAVATVSAPRLPLSVFLLRSMKSKARSLLLCGLAMPISSGVEIRGQEDKNTSDADMSKLMTSRTKCRKRRRTWRRRCLRLARGRRNRWLSYKPWAGNKPGNGTAGKAGATETGRRLKEAARCARPRRLAGLDPKLP